jgi:hypothetical protein
MNRRTIEQRPINRAFEPDSARFIGLRSSVAGRFIAARTMQNFVVKPLE